MSPNSTTDKLFSTVYAFRGRRYKSFDINDKLKYFPMKFELLVSHHKLRSLDVGWPVLRLIILWNIDIQSELITGNEIQITILMCLRFSFRLYNFSIYFCNCLPEYLIANLRQNVERTTEKRS